MTFHARTVTLEPAQKRQTTACMIQTDTNLQTTRAQELTNLTTGRRTEAASLAGTTKRSNNPGSIGADIQAKEGSLSRATEIVVT